MFPFRYVRAKDVASAVKAAADPDTHLIAGGTNLVDLMRIEVMRPKTVVDITRLPLASIEQVGDGVRIGALVRNTDLAVHPLIATRYPVLAQALLAGASHQLRNMATVGGNLLQRTRCPYFRDRTWACNKREPGSGCSALEGYTRSHAVLGGSDRCIATNPSDMSVALVALDAVVIAQSVTATRRIPIADFHTIPGAHPEIESVLARGELITHVELPGSRFAERSRYVKVRDRASYAFALASAAVALDIRGTTIGEARVALGGVATKPWRAVAAERALAGAPVNADSFRRAAEAALEGAAPRPDNAFKVELAKRTIVRALSLAGGVT
jgi:xanthine dehydrogenase YagS FAD-binding subunit